MPTSKSEHYSDNRMLSELEKEQLEETIKLLEEKLGYKIKVVGE